MSKKRATTKQREVVIERAQGCCEYCQSQASLSMSPFSVEHITPQSAGGETKLDNLALACQGCNGHKYDKEEGVDPVTGLPSPLYHPRQQKWTDHFAWNENCTEIIGMTSVGRATIAILKLNRIELVNLREILYAAGIHPPKMA
jgi:hypothetical protein